MKTLDHFTLYPEKFLSSFDCQMMDICEFGAYCKILFASFLQSKPCYILNEDASLAKLCNLSLERWLEIKPNVLKKFTVEGFYIYNQVLLDIWKVENKQKTTKKKVQLTMLTNMLNYTFDQFWNDYDKKVGNCPRLVPKWLKLTDEERDAIRIHIPRYKEAQPDKYYRVNPEKYLNERRWEAELPKKQNYQQPKGKVIDYNNERREEI